MGYNLDMKVYWGYNLFTDYLLCSWDIQAKGNFSYSNHPFSGANSRTASFQGGWLFHGFFFLESDVSVEVFWTKKHHPTESWELYDSYPRWAEGGEYLPYVCILAISPCKDWPCLTRSNPKKQSAHEQLWLNHGIFPPWFRWSSEFRSLCIDHGLCVGQRPTLCSYRILQ